MAAIDYDDIKNELAEILRLNANLRDLEITIDEDIRLDSFGTSLNIEMLRRDSSAPAQSLAGGQKQRYYLTVVISVIAVALERQQAVKSRDSIIGKVEVAVMGNRTLNGKVNTAILQGGELLLLKNTSSDSDGYYVAAGEVIIALDAEISTV